MGRPLDMNAQPPEDILISGMHRACGRQCGQKMRERGQSLVELAFVVPLLLLLLVGIIEIGRFAYYSILVSNAARAGAQYGAQSLANASDGLGIAAAANRDGQGGTGLTVSSTQRMRLHREHSERIMSSNPVRSAEPCSRLCTG